MIATESMRSSSKTISRYYPLEGLSRRMYRISHHRIVFAYSLDFISSFNHAILCRPLVFRNILHVLVPSNQQLEATQTLSTVSVTDTKVCRRVPYEAHIYSIAKGRTMNLLIDKLGHVKNRDLAGTSPYSTEIPKTRKTGHTGKIRSVRSPVTSQPT